MADKEAETPGDGGPSLEMPSLGFGRKKKARRDRAADEPPREEAAVAEAAPVPPAPESVEPAEAVAAAEPVEAVEPAEVTRSMDPIDQVPEPEARPLFVDEEPEPAPVATQTDPQPEAAPEPEPAPEPRRKADRGPLLTGMPAAVVTGAFIGLLLVGLTWGSLHLCELLRGTSTCGKPGFLVLLAIMVILVVVGAVLLKAFRVGDPGATSFLGVGLVAVLILLFLVKLLFNWWMVLVVPVLGMIAFALAYWLSTAFVERD